MADPILKIDYREVMEYSLDPLIIHTDYKILYVNKAAEEFFKTTREEVVGMSPLDIFQESSKAGIRRRIQSAYSGPAEVIEETVYRMDQTPVTVELYCHPVRIGDKQAIQSYVKDITERKEIERKQRGMMGEINELSATIVPIMDEIGVLPLVGNIDQDKARSILEIIPEKVKEQSLSHLIIDFSGVYALDDMVIDYLFKITSVLSLLGVRSILTGLRPELAIEAIKLHIDSVDIPTMATVKEAVSYLRVQ